MQETFAAETEHDVDPVPEHQRRNAQHDAGDQDRRDHQSVIGGAKLRPYLGQHQRAGQPHDDGKNDRAEPDNQAVLDAVNNTLVVIQHVEPFEGQAFPGHGAGKAR